MYKVAFCTLGCKVNQYETDKIKEEFIKNNWKIVEFNKKADVYIINSCSVTNLATRKTRNYLSRAKKLGGICVLIGCYAQELQSKENFDALDIADIILGNDEKKDVYLVINEYIKNKKKNKVYKVSDISKSKKYIKSDILNEAFDIRESIKIEDGCNNFCSYCIIPYVRGRVRSRNISDIISEAKKLVNTGVRELVVVGIEISSYGVDLDKKIDLIDVIEELAKIDGLLRIRLGSIEPRILSKSNIERLKNIDKLCHHFHISTQSLDDDVLKNMNRKYDSSFILEVTNNLHEAFEDVILTCDIIVGFPGETDIQFENTLNMLKKIKFYEVHTFKYSKRKWTRAATMPGQVSGEVANYRSNKLITLSNKIKEEIEKSYIGKKVDVLIEKYSNEYLEGYTKNYIKVRVKGDKSLCQKVLEVELSSIEKDYMLGTI